SSLPQPVTPTSLSSSLCIVFSFSPTLPSPPPPPLFPYTTLFRSFAKLPGSRRDKIVIVTKFGQTRQPGGANGVDGSPAYVQQARSEEHTSELQSHLNLVCRLLLEKKKITFINMLSKNLINLVELC